MKTNLSFVQILEKCRAFVELLPIYLRCTERVQALVVDMTRMIGDADTREEDRERALGTVAGALLAFAGEQEALPRGSRGSVVLSIPSSTKAAWFERQCAFGERVKALRTQKGWTQGDLAKQSGVGQSAISMLESGQSRPQAGTLAKPAKALGVDKNELWLGESPGGVDEREKKARRGADGAAHGTVARLAFSCRNALRLITLGEGR